MIKFYRLPILLFLLCHILLEGFGQEKSLSFTPGNLPLLPNYIPADGLIAWYPFNGNANDESGNGNNGTERPATYHATRK